VTGASGADPASRSVTGAGGAEPASSGRRADGAERLDDLAAASGADPALAAALTARIAGCKALAGDADLRHDVQLALVVARLELPAIVRGTLRLAASLPDGVARAWAGNFTKCLVLAGEPRKIAPRFPVARTEGDGAVAWVGPGAARDLDPLRRLLRPLKTVGPLALPDVRVTLDRAHHGALAIEGRAPDRGATAPPRAAVVTMATAGLRLEEYLVSLEHTLAEASLLGRLDGVFAIDLRHEGVLDAPPPAAAYARVHKGRPGDPVLRLYATVVASLD